MSNREKNLVFLLLIVCIAVVGFKFLVEPQMLIAADNDSMYAELQAEKEALDSVTAANAEFSETYEENVANLEDLKENISVYLEDEALDTMLTVIAKNTGVTINELSIGQEDSSYIAEGLEAVTVKTVTLTVEGTEKQFMSLQEELYNRTDCIISSASIQSASDSSSENQMVITAVVYMQGDVQEVEEGEDTQEGTTADEEVAE